MRRVLLIGATGLVGGALAELLLRIQDREIHALVRRPSGCVARGWHELVAPAEQWPEIAAAAGCDIAVSALGTTMRAAGSQAAFRAVDLDHVVAFARAARAAGARQMISVSSVGARPDSANFYLRIKGEMERELGRVGFDRLDIVRPGLLRGRRGADRRFGERLGILVSPVANVALRGPLARYAAVDASTVARAMAGLVGREGSGVFIHHNRDLMRLAA